MERFYTCYACAFPFKAREDALPVVCPSCGGPPENYIVEPGDATGERRLHVDPPAPDPDRDPLDHRYHHPKYFPAGTRDGRIRRFVLSYDDLEATRSFYEGVFGWDIIDRDTTDPAAPLMFAATGPGNPNWEPSVPSFTYGYLRPRAWDRTGRDPRHMVEVDSIDATVQKVLAAGGRLLAETYEEDGQLFAVVEDTEGNPYYLWQTPDTVTWDEPESQTMTSPRRHKLV